MDTGTTTDAGSQDITELERRLSHVEYQLKQPGNQAGQNDQNPNGVLNEALQQFSSRLDSHENRIEN